MDAQVFKKNLTLETDLYCKYTDRHEKSCYNHVCKKFVPFGQEIRLRRIICDDIVLDERLKEIQTRFISRCYNSGKVISEKKKLIP